MIKQFSFKEQLPVLEELFKIHWEEVASNKHNRNLNPNIPFYLALEEKNYLICVGSFIEDKLVGYAINIITNDLHDREKFMCVSDALYVSPEFRKGSMGIKLIKETENLASLSGCYSVIWHAKPNTKLDVLLEKLNYEVKDFLYMKEV